jgi:hypothetical protein
MRRPDWMTAWMSRLEPREPEAPVKMPPPHKRRMSGKYQALYVYLEHRYADTVVLTFEQIESLLGFALPEGARTESEWWTSPGTGAVPSGHGDAWILASRTAAPNFQARTVVFERVSS